MLTSVQKIRLSVAIAVVAGLEQYSERGEEYIKELRSMIRYNKLDQYDQ